MLYPSSLEPYFETPAGLSVACDHMTTREAEPDVSKALQGPVFAMEFWDKETNKKLNPTDFSLLFKGSGALQVCHFEFNEDGTFAPFGTAELKLSQVATGHINTILESVKYIIRRSVNVSRLDKLTLLRPDKDEERPRLLYIKALYYTAHL